jgi:hypothetical protein
MKFKNIEKKLDEWSIGNIEERNLFLKLYSDNKDRLSNYKVNILQAESLEEAKKVIIAIKDLSFKTNIIKELIPDHTIYSEKMKDVILFLYEDQIKEDKQSVKRTLLTLKNNFKNQQELELFLMKSYIERKSVTVKKDYKDIIFENADIIIIKPKDYDDFINLNPPESWCISSRSTYNNYLKNYDNFYMVLFKENKNKKLGISRSVSQILVYDQNNNRISNKSISLVQIDSIISKDAQKSKFRNEEIKYKKNKIDIEEFMNIYNKIKTAQ